MSTKKPGATKPDATEPDQQADTTPEAQSEAASSFEETMSGWSTAGEVEAALAAETIQTLEAENAALKDRMVRTMADMENLRRRTERELRDGRQYAIAKFAKDVLTVSDNLRRALDSVSEEARTAADEVLTALLSGVEVTERDLLNMFERHGVSQMEPQGEKFDPNQHEAVFQVPDTSVPDGTVVQVMQAGYKIGERVLRPAIVGVSTGGAKRAPEPEAATPKPEPEAAPEAAAEAGEKPSEEPTPEPGSRGGQDRLISIAGPMSG